MCYLSGLKQHLREMAPLRKYPVGIQSFEKIRTDGYIYVDKTPLIYKMITEGCPYFLSRPGGAPSWCRRCNTKKPQENPAASLCLL